MSDDGSGGEEEEVNPLWDLWPDFEPMQTFTGSRINDIVDSLANKQPTVLNLDATLPQGDAQLPVLQSILWFMPKSVKTLSLRFNMLTADTCQMLVEWASVNDTIEVLYLAMTNMDEKYRGAIEANWRKLLAYPRTDNQGFTMIRIQPPPEEPTEDE
jgi:hypothetical protein